MSHEHLTDEFFAQVEQIQQKAKEAKSEILTFAKEMGAGGIFLAKKYCAIDPVYPRFYTIVRKEEHYDFNPLADFSRFTEDVAKVKTMKNINNI